jgi:hypothetical protein
MADADTWRTRGYQVLESLARVQLYRKRLKDLIDQRPRSGGTGGFEQGVSKNS